MTNTTTGSRLMRTLMPLALLLAAACSELTKVDAPDVTQPSSLANAEGALELDRLIHERARLGILSALAVNESLTFNDLKRLIHATDGNLSVHARKLEEAGYVACTKSFEGRMPKTEYTITPVGRRALERYLDHMEAIIRRTREH